MKNLWTIGTAVALLLTSAPGAGADATTSPGKNSVMVSSSGLTVGGTLVTLASGTIAKAKPKTVVEVDLTMTDVGNFSYGIGLALVVNGFTNIAQPQVVYGYQFTQCDASGYYNCTASAHFWLDVDAAELAHPGMIRGLPLVLDLQATSVGNITAQGTATLRATVHRK